MNDLKKFKSLKTGKNSDILDKSDDDGSEYDSETENDKEQLPEFGAQPNIPKTCTF